MSEMEQRVARAMARLQAQRLKSETVLGWNPSEHSMQSYVDRHWKEWIDFVRVAIKAMREPTEAMELAGQVDPSPVSAGLIWRTMIDEILKD